MATEKKYLYHIAAILTATIWGVTFVSTKVLIEHGLHPAEILLYRFILAYVGIWFFCPKTLFAKSRKDELLFVILGLCGGSLYFVFENTALKITLASNVSLLICMAPIFTAFLTFLFYRKEKLKSSLIFGSFIALLGVALVVFNGSFILQINPLGDVLTLLAALSWAFYSIILRQLNGKYSTLFITRKVFFYGIVTLIPYLIVNKVSIFHLDIFSDSVVVLNLLFLGIVASLLCYIMWNTAIKQLGVLQTSNYIYLTPLVTLLASSILIDEKITIVALIGSIFILSGVYIAEKGFTFRLK